MSDLFLHQQSSANRAVLFSIVALGLIGAAHIHGGDRLGLMLVLLSLTAGHWVEQINMAPEGALWALRIQAKVWVVAVNAVAWAAGIAAALLAVL